MGPGVSRRHKPPENPLLIALGCCFLALMAYAVAKGLPPLMVGGDCATGQTGTGPQMRECTAEQNRGAVWLAIGTVALFPAIFLSRSFTFLPGAAATLLLTGLAARDEIAKPRVPETMSDQHEQVLDGIALGMLGGGAVLGVFAIVALVRLAARTRAAA